MYRFRGGSSPVYFKYRATTYLEIPGSVLGTYQDITWITHFYTCLDHPGFVSALAPYDQWALKAVKYKITAIGHTSGSLVDNSANVSNMGKYSGFRPSCMYCTCVDYDDAIPVTSIPTLVNQYANAKVANTATHPIHKRFVHIPKAIRPLRNNANPASQNAHNANGAIGLRTEATLSHALPPVGTAYWYLEVTFYVTCYGQIAGLIR